MNTPQVQDLITSLLLNGSLPKTRCSAALLRKVQPLLDSGVLAEERCGAGRRLTVRDHPALAAFYNQSFPQAEAPFGADSRLAGVAHYRNSKTFANDTPEIVCVRAWQERVLMVGSEPVPALSATRQFGAFSFLLRPEISTIQAPCALVENPTVFTRFEQLRLPVGLVIYGQGRASNRLLEWLGRQDSSEFNLLHLPDYDPVGLSEFERLRSRLGPRVRLHLPAELEDRFQRFGNRDLLANATSQALLKNLRQTASPDTRLIVELINRYNAGLEQEALLL